MTNDIHVEELLPAYALGCLDEDEVAAVANHLAGCSLCRAELRAFQTVANELALVVPDVAPPRHLKGRLLERVQPVRPPARPRSTDSWWLAVQRTFGQRAMRVWAPLSLLLILALAAVNLFLWQRISQLETAAGPGQMQAVPLSSTDAAPDASGYVVISPDGRNGAIVVDGLPVLDEAHEYQLWLIRDGQRTSGAVFSVDEDGYRGTRIEAPESLFEYEAVGISPEPAGGSPAPTGEPVLQGTLFPR